MNARKSHPITPGFFPLEKNKHHGHKFNENLGDFSFLPVDSISEILNYLDLKAAYNIYNTNTNMQNVMNKNRQLKSSIIEYQAIHSDLVGLQHDLDQMNASKFDLFFKKLTTSYQKDKYRYDDKWWHMVRDDEDRSNFGSWSTDDGVNPYILTLLSLLAIAMMTYVFLTMLPIIAVVAIAAVCSALAVIPTIASITSNTNELVKNQIIHDDYKCHELEGKKDKLRNRFFSLGDTRVESLTMNSQSKLSLSC